MCVIAVKDENSEFSREKLRNCFVTNQDGAGFAVARHSSVRIEKGFFRFDDLWEAMRDVGTGERLAMIHFRTATEGAIVSGNCQPFAVSERALDARSATAEAAFAHNGMIDVSEASVQGDWASDSYRLVRDIVAPLFEQADDALFGTTLDALALNSRSKFAFMTAQGILTFGDGWVEDEGIWYSNRSFKPDRRRLGFYRRFDSTFLEDRCCDWCGARSSLVVNWEGFRVCETCAEFLEGEDPWSMAEPDEQCPWCGGELGEGFFVGGFDGASRICEACYEHLLAEER